MKKQISNFGNYPVVEANEEGFVFLDELNKKIAGHEVFIARGSGRCYGDSALSKNTISTLKFDKILSFDTERGVFECQTGITLEQVLTVIVPKGWFLPVTPGTKLITIGGAVASNVHGKNHKTQGSFSQHIIDMDVLLASGETLTCSADTHADLFEATCGGMGLTGVITRVKFGLLKIATSFMRQKQIKAKNLDELIGLFDEYRDSTYSVVWIDCLKKGKHFGRSILTVAEHADFEDLSNGHRRQPLQLPGEKKLTLPPVFPWWTINSFTVKAFNFLFYAKNYAKEMSKVVLYDPFFYTLDAINHWNRIYGNKGFVQYQFVLPYEAKQGLEEILKHIGKRGWGSFLTVLKVLGKQESMISFCREGYTLAVDFPIRKGIFEFFDELDEILLKHGGRIYITKDARMKPEMLKNYPELEKFKSIVKKYNPDGRIRSLQSDRLKLTQQ